MPRLSKQEAVEMFARQFEARHRSGAVIKARETASALKRRADDEGHDIWNEVAIAVERLRNDDHIHARRSFEQT
jgi:hypothetical protein